VKPLEGIIVEATPQRQAEREVARSQDNQCFRPRDLVDVPYHLDVSGLGRSCLSDQLREDLVEQRVAQVVLVVPGLTADRRAGILPRRGG